MRLKIKEISLVPDKYGKRIEITKVGLYDDDGKWIRWIKLNDAFLDLLKNAELKVKV